MKDLHKIALSMLVLALSLMVTSPAFAGEEHGTMKIHDSKSAGAVYTMTNGPIGNEVIRYDRAADGTLSLSGSFSTNGLGTGSSLGNQGGLVLSDDGRMLLVVNAGSNEISAFRVESNSLVLTDKFGSGGTMPVSIAIRREWVYVLNAGGTGNITGFYLSDSGKLSPIPGSNRALSGEATEPAQISFHPYWNVLAVTEKATNIIDTYTVDFKGRLAKGPITHASNGQTPFGFAFDIFGNLIVSEAPGSALSSYAVDYKGNLKTISSSVPDFQKAACWVVVTKDGRFAYTANAGSNTISSYKNRNGKITLLDQMAGTTGDGPIDMALSSDSRFLYNLNSRSHTITGFRINVIDGSLTPVTTVGGLPAGASGIAAQGDSPIQLRQFIDRQVGGIEKLMVPADRREALSR